MQSADDAQLADVPESAELDSPIDREELHRCLDLLSPEHREALVLRFFEEMSYEDIARYGWHRGHSALAHSLRQRSFQKSMERKAT